MIWRAVRMPPLADVVGLDARAHVEVGAQACISFEPELVVRLNPVDVSVFPCKVAHGSVHLVVVGNAVDVIILRERSFQLRRECLLGCVANAEYPDAVLLQFIAKLPIFLGKIGRNKNEILHNANSLSFCENEHAALYEAAVHCIKAYVICQIVCKTKKL